MYDKNYYNGLTGQIVTPNDFNYDEARQVWNRSIQRFPAVIVYCYNKSDVRNAVLWAQKKCVGIRIRTGRHNYEGYSVGNDVLVIDISRMNNLKFDRRLNILKIDGGVINTQIYEFLGNQGYPFSSGTCPTVGAAGLTLGGGWGLSCRNFGLACDNLIELEIIDYKGNIITANKDKNPDLFWACRGGGGGNFGVTVSMSFKVPKKVDKVTYIEFHTPQSSKEDMEQFIYIWQNWLINLNEKITLVSRLFNSEMKGIEIHGTGIFYGTPDEAISIMKPFYNVRGMEIDVQYLPFIEAIEIIEGVYPKHEKFKTAGRFVNINYNCSELGGIVGLVQTRPKGSKLTGLSLYALGGKVKDVDRHDTAFYYRDAKYIIALQTMWKDNKYKEDNIKWFDERFKYLKSVTRGSYINFPYNKLKCYDKEYYGENACMLQKINNKYDPCNVFRFPQSINQ